MTYDFLQCSDTVGWAAGRASALQKAGFWFVVGDNLTGVLHIFLRLQLNHIPSANKIQNGVI